MDEFLRQFGHWMHPLPSVLKIDIRKLVQCLSQDLESGCLKLAVIKFWGVQIFKGDHNILIVQP